MSVIRSLLCIYCLLAPALLTAEQQSAVAQLSQQLQGMNSLQAHFSQEIKDDKGNILQTASGLVNVKRPRRLHWHTLAPYQHLVVTDGNTLWLYDIDLEQVTQQAFSADLDKAPALLLSGDVEQITRQYDVRLVPAPANNTDNMTFELTARNKEGLFNRLTIAFSAGKPRAMFLRDSFDQQTRIEFTQVKLNPGIDNALFRFTAPKGIDIINNDQRNNDS